MLWFFFLVAVALAFLAITNRIDGLDGWVTRACRKARAAWDYAREDIEDIEHELRSKAETHSAPEPEAAEEAAEEAPAKAARANGPTLVDDKEDTPSDAIAGKTARSTRPRARRATSAG